MKTKTDRLGMNAERARKAAADAEAKALAAVNRNDNLLESSDFRAFLVSIANRGGYLDASAEQSDWMDGYRAACRDIVNGILRNSTKAAKFIEEFLANKAIKPKNGDNE